VNRMNQPDRNTQSPRCELRRQQVLDAAAECFRHAGFHGASIAQISKTAGMSPGHLYYLFDSKEAIIAGIVERNLESSLEIISRLEAATDVLGDMLDGVVQALGEKSDPDRVGLWIEVLAEAARNPEVARVVREADGKVRERIGHLAETARKSRGIEPRLDPDAVVEVLVGMFEGMANRIVQNPDRDNQAVAEVLRVAMTAVLEA